MSNKENQTQVKKISGYRDKTHMKAMLEALKEANKPFKAKHNKDLFTIKSDDNGHIVTLPDGREVLRALRKDSKGFIVRYDEQLFQ
jgi:hypothetical protein